ncbi:MAG: hypothetical protein DMD81_17365, partial [Candidatus Rokuibacteriota bacterium]
MAKHAATRRQGESAARRGPSTSAIRRPGGKAGPRRPAIASIDPASGEVVKTFEPYTAADVDTRLERARQTFRAYRLSGFAERARMMARAAEILDEHREEFGRLMTREMGKPFRAAVEEAQKCAWACRVYAEHAAAWLADEVVETTATRSFIHYQPLGPVLAVMPWNFPFWQVFRF